MAKIPPEKLSSNIKKQLSAVYLISGDETLLVHEACESIRKTARKQGFAQHEVHHVEGNFNWDNFLMGANEMSLFSDKKVIEVRIKNGKPGDAGGKALKAYCGNIPDDTILILVLPKIDKRSENTAWYKAVASAGDTITIWPINTQQLPRWIETRMHAAGLSAEPQAIDVLCAKIEGNLLAAVQEIEKLKLLSDSKFIDAATMAAAVTDSARYNVFDLIDKALAGDSRAAVDCLSGLRAEGNSAPVILWALVNQVRTLTQIMELTQAGRSFDAAAQHAKVWKNKMTLVRRASQRTSLSDLHWLLRKCALADRVIKGINKGDAWNELLDITLGLTGVNALSKRSKKLALNI